MTRARGQVVGLWVAGLAALSVSGCNAILGISDDPVVGKAAAPGCVLNSDCTGDNKVCLFRVCSPPCKKDRDCDQAHGERCVRADQGAACVADARTVCAPGGPACEKGTSCVGGKCFSDCSTDAGACLVDQACASDKVCRVVDASVPKMDGSGPDSARPADASVSDASLSDARVSDGSSPRECDPEGATRCDGNAQSARSICQDGKWTATDACADGSLCDTSSSPAGTCLDVEPNCFGHAPGESFCDGASRIVCGPDLVTAQTMQCQSAQHCSSVSSGCAACLDNEFTCDGNKLMKCKPDHSGFELNKTCPADPPCSAQAGDCTTHACSPMQKRCNGDRLEQCNADQSAFAFLETCSPGLCDSQGLECDKCVAKSASCANGMVRICSDDGQVQTDQACPAGTPICTGNGTCVACLDATNCTRPNDCYGATCNAGTCGFPPIGPGIGCNGGVCDGSGNCVQCLFPGQCNAMGECYTGSCGTDHACAYTQRGAGQTCSGGYCNASGACVECLNSGHCSGSKPICSAQGACIDCSMDVQCSAKGVGLDHCRAATGACVACVSSGQCAAATTPICDTTSFTCRGCTQGSPPTSGDTECAQRNASAAPACKSNGSCVKCTGTNASACTGATPFCATSTNLCVHCLANTSCSGTTPICVGGACSACSMSSECAANADGLGACKTSTGACVACVTSGDCGGNNVCESDNTCCTPDSPSVSCGLSTCGNAIDNCGDFVSCGDCGMANCCELSNMPGVFQCRSLLCD